MRKTLLIFAVAAVAALAAADEAAGGGSDGSAGSSSGSSGSGVQAAEPVPIPRPVPRAEPVQPAEPEALNPLFDGFGAAVTAVPESGDWAAAPAAAAGEQQQNVDPAQCKFTPEPAADSVSSYSSHEHSHVVTLPFLSFLSRGTVQLDSPAFPSSSPPPHPVAAPSSSFPAAS